MAETSTSERCKYRYSGHGTFPFRYTWLPKAVRHLAHSGDLFCNDDEAMVRLGVGKNMVRAIRFWVDAARVACNSSARSGQMEVTPLGRLIFGENGFDEFLEDSSTLWLLHWNLSTQWPSPLFAWHYLLNRWHRADFTRGEVLTAFRTEMERENRKLSDITLEQHFTVFLHTYVPARATRQELVEDSLDCPLVDLEFIQELGERPDGSGRREKIYAFRIQDKPEIPAELFVYCLSDFWNKRFSREKTLSIGQVAIGECSPGQVFKLPEHAVRERLESIERDSSGLFAYQESVSIQQIVRKCDPKPDALLRKVYQPAMNKRSK